MPDRGEQVADYVYDPREWEVTYGWDDRSLLVDDWPLQDLLDEPIEFATLRKGPPVWAVAVVKTRDDNGDPDEVEVQWFTSRDEAVAVLLGNKNRGRDG